jgi:hypothetical protein
MVYSFQALSKGKAEVALGLPLEIYFSLIYPK